MISAGYMGHTWLEAVCNVAPIALMRHCCLLTTYPRGRLGLWRVLSRSDRLMSCHNFYRVACIVGLLQGNLSCPSRQSTVRFVCDPKPPFIHTLGSPTPTVFFVHTRRSPRGRGKETRQTFSRASASPVRRVARSSAAFLRLAGRPSRCRSSCPYTAAKSRRGLGWCTRHASIILSSERAELVCYSEELPATQLSRGLQDLGFYAFTVDPLLLW